MLLADLGNSRLKWLHEADLAAGAPADAVSWRGRPLAAVLDRCWSRLPVPEAVVAACVAGPAAAQTLAQWCRRHWRLEPRFVRTGARACGVRNGYREPGRLGVDRWAALVGAHWQVSGPKVVADAGSALTVDLLRADGAHLGGFIAPGISAMRQALERLAPHVFAGPVPPVPAAAGRSTGECAAAGTAAAAAGLVERAAARLARESDSDSVTVVLCGGEAPLLEPLLSGTVRVEPDLVLHGLACLARSGEAGGEGES